MFPAGFQPPAAQGLAEQFLFRATSLGLPHDILHAPPSGVTSKVPLQSSNAKPNKFDEALGLALTAAVSAPAAAGVPQGMKGFRCVRPSQFLSPDIGRRYPCPGATLPQVLHGLVPALAANECDFKVTIHPSAASEVHFGADGVKAVAHVLETPTAAGQPPEFTLLLQRLHGDAMACELLFYHLARDTRVVPGLVQPLLLIPPHLDDDYDFLQNVKPSEKPFMLNPADAAAAAADAAAADDGEPVKNPQFTLSSGPN